RPHPGRRVRALRPRRSCGRGHRPAFDRQEAGDARPAEPTFATRRRGSEADHHHAAAPSVTKGPRRGARQFRNTAVLSESGFLIRLLDASWRSFVIVVRSALDLLFHRTSHGCANERMPADRWPAKVPGLARSVQTAHARYTRQEKTSRADPRAFY